MAFDLFFGFMSQDSGRDNPCHDYLVEFLNRVSELTLLRQRLGGSRAEFLVVYGRRRVGKTELLAHLASEVRSFYGHRANAAAS
jgi:ATPase domain predominantly from Archaea